MTNQPYVTENKPAGKGTGIASLVCGIISVVCCCSYLCIPAIVCGIISVVQSNKAGSKINGLAIAGLILGGIALIFLIASLWLYTTPEYQEMYNQIYGDMLSNMDM